MYNKTNYLNSLFEVIMTKEKNFNILITLSLILFIIILILGIILKVTMPNDVVENYKFLQAMSIKERVIRGLQIKQFYQTEFELGIIKRTIILDFFNLIIFIPFGIFVTNYFKKYRILKAVLTSLLFCILIEIIQLITIFGAFMLNDIIINTIGGIIGSILFVIITKNKNYKIYNVLLLVFIVVCSFLSIFLIIKFINNIDIYINILNKTI